MRRVLLVFLIVCMVLPLASCCNCEKNPPETPVCTCNCCCGAESTSSPEESRTSPVTQPGTESSNANTDTQSPPDTTKAPETTVSAPETEPTPQGDDLLLEFNVKIPEATFSGLPVLNNQKFIVKDPYNKRGLSTSPYAFSFGAAKDGKPQLKLEEAVFMYDRDGNYLQSLK